jgi:hypothetical protein
MGTARKGQFQGRPTLLLARLLCSRKSLAFVHYRTKRSTFPTTIHSTHRQCQILQSTTPLSRMALPICRHHGPLSPARRVRRLYHGVVTLLALTRYSPCVRQHQEPCLLRLLQLVKPHGPSAIPRCTIGNLQRCSSWMITQLSARVFIRM